MHKVKITVLSVELKQKMIAEYGYSDLKECPLHKEGDIFVTDFRKPDTFCADAWCCIQKYVFALAHTRGPLFWDDWAETWQGRWSAAMTDSDRSRFFLSRWKKKQRHFSMGKARAFFP